MINYIFTEDEQRNYLEALPDPFKVYQIVQQGARRIPIEKDGVIEPKMKLLWESPLGYSLGGYTITTQMRVVARYTHARYWSGFVSFENRMIADELRRKAIEFAEISGLSSTVIQCWLRKSWVTNIGAYRSIAIVYISPTIVAPEYPKEAMSLEEFEQVIDEIEALKRRKDSK